MFESFTELNYELKPAVTTFGPLRTNPRASLRNIVWVLCTYALELLYKLYITMAYVGKVTEECPRQLFDRLLR